MTEMSLVCSGCQRYFTANTADGLPAMQVFCHGCATQINRVIGGKLEAATGRKRGSIRLSGRRRLEG